ncbi:MAG: NAD(P)/FAD-dependent oxidoreductase [Pseudomonadota bacterium]
MTEPSTTVVIGAGHNALVCATYLARAGRRVTCLEAAAMPGGMASYRAFGEGYSAPIAHAQYPLDDRLVKDLDLEQHGYRAGAPAPTTVLDPEGQTLSALGTDLSGAGATRGDQAAYRALRAGFAEFADCLAPLFDSAPPRLKHLGMGELRGLSSLALRLRFGLGREKLQELLRVAGMNIYDLLDEHFADERIKGLMALEALQGSAMGPRTPGTVLTWLHRLANAHDRFPAIAADADRSIGTALANALRAAGGELRYDTKVRAISIEDSRATGVILSDGERIRASTVISGVDPRATFEELLGLPSLDAAFARRITQIRGRGVVAKLHLGLNSLPAFPGLTPETLGGRMLVAPSADYVEKAFNPSKYGRHSPAPVLEITMPSLANASLAPEGKHVMSMNISFVPYQTQGDTDAFRQSVLDSALDTLGEYDRALRSRVVCSDLMTPTDLEAQFGAVQGHWHHGELSMHQSLMLRPLYGAARYAAPVRGVYLCSAGCHPGGDVSGRPGRNAAAAILAAKDAP